jgi:hypothetical protein
MRSPPSPVAAPPIALDPINVDPDQAFDEGDLAAQVDVRVHLVALSEELLSKPDAFRRAWAHTRCTVDLLTAKTRVAALATGRIESLKPV